MNNNFQSFFKLRNRTSWEAADSGLLLWRRKGFILIFLYALPVVILTVIMECIPVKINLIIALAFIWWLKPLYERLVLQFIQLLFFRKTISVKLYFNGLSKTILTSLAGDLLWRRFSLMRCSLVPIRVLEGLRKKDVGLRKLALQRGGISFCAILTVICSVIEVVLYAGEIVFLMVLNSIIDFNLLEEIQNKYQSILFLVPSIINMTLVGSIYVCAVFSIYINSRVLVEGWDLQLLFRKEKE